MSRFMPGVKISAVHGEMQKIGDRFVIPMFHPAAALHQAALRPSLLADFTRLPELLKEARRELGREARVSKTPPRPPKPVQLSLF
jgi:DNA polymerase